jgi:PKD repeat protein
VLAAIGLLAVAGAGCDEGVTITATELSATCTATPSSGPAPLEVAFNVGVAGAQGTVSVTVSYGDGTTGDNPDANHTYAGPGLYTASFDVRTASQAARCATTVDVGPAEPEVVENLPPEVVFKTNPRVKDGRITGTAPFTVWFNMCLTADPEGDALYFTMDLDGDGKLDVRGRTGASCREPWDYPVGTWKSKNCVTDVTPEGMALHPRQCRTYTVVANP